MSDGQPVHRRRRAPGALHPRLWPRLRPKRAQGDVDGPRRPRLARRRIRRRAQGPGAGRGVRALALRQRAGDGLRRAPQATPLCRLPGGARSAAPAPAGRRRHRGGRRVTTYNFAYLDEQTKRMIRRAILKAAAIPGYQVPFASREMPMPYGWGTGGVQVTAAVLGPDDVLKVIDQGADDTTNAVSIRKFFAKVADVATTTS